MVGIETRIKPPMTERKIGQTTYIVTSHFSEKGATATEKIKRLIDIETNENRTTKSS